MILPASKEFPYLKTHNHSVRTMNRPALLSLVKRVAPYFFLLIMFLTLVPTSWAEEFLLFYGNDVRGELQPCG
ncbi:MAG: hypothetical protein D3908_08505 [Candidatus Electrothrix sp. AUS4]|nr:hypothetical protein [Candidatus Electrothrix sp. AUS4]